MRLEPDIDNKKTNLSKAELKKLVAKKKDSIKKLISQVKHCKNITLSLAITGEYMISTKRPKWWERVIPAMSAIKPLLQKGLNKVLKQNIKILYFLKPIL